MCGVCVCWCVCECVCVEGGRGGVRGGEQVSNQVERQVLLASVLAPAARTRSTASSQHSGHGSASAPARRPPSGPTVPLIVIVVPRTPSTYGLRHVSRMSRQRNSTRWILLEDGLRVVYRRNVKRRGTARRAATHGKTHVSAKPMPSSGAASATPIATDAFGGMRAVASGLPADWV